MKIYIVNCKFNILQSLVDCTFQNAEAATAYAKELNTINAKGVARCKDLIAKRYNKAMVKFLDEEGGIKFEVLPVDLK